jgi:hypothetical protein
VLLLAGHAARAPRMLVRLLWLFEYGSGQQAVAGEHFQQFTTPELEQFTKKFLAIYIGNASSPKRSEWNALDEAQRKKLEASGMQA